MSFRQKIKGIKSGIARKKAKQGHLFTTSNIPPETENKSVITDIKNIEINC